jgi:hypothetical protein
MEKEDNTANSGWDMDTGREIDMDTGREIDMDTGREIDMDTGREIDTAGTRTDSREKQSTVAEGSIGILGCSLKWS